ncbi:BadF/BadG/BcrA/BcrD ATPase family protein [Escherichia coli]
MARATSPTFLMNDKCAAGTGRLLEVITRTLGARVEQLDELPEASPTTSAACVPCLPSRGDQPALGGRRARSDSRRSD